jgi:hypothetical protein
VLFAFLIGFVVASLQSERISQLWLQVQGQAEVTSIGAFFRPISYSARANVTYPRVCAALHEQLFKRLLSENDIRNPLITPGSSVDRRSHPMVNFILSAFFPSLRGQGR